MTGKTLKGLVAIITGAGQGIGAAIAAAYARAGARVVITGRTASKLEQVAEKLHRDDVLRGQPFLSAMVDSSNVHRLSS